MKVNSRGALDAPLFSVTLRINDATRKFVFREDNVRDKGVMEQIFRHSVYDLRPFAHYQRLLAYQDTLINAGRTPLIVDAGANIGASVIYFSTVFPHCRVIAIEPEQINCQLLRTNCEGLNYELMEGRLGSSNGNLFLQDPGLGEVGYRLGANGSYQVPVFGAENLLSSQIAKGLAPLIFKIDIEGGEAGLFREKTTWLSQCALLIIELHDYLFPGEAVSRSFLRAISDLNFDFISRGGNIFCFNNDLLKDSRFFNLQPYANSESTDGRDMNFVERNFGSFIGSFCSGGVCLDVGCGNGRLNKILAPRFDKVINLDQKDQRDMIYAYPNCEYVEANFFDYSVEQKFDVIVFWGSFLVMYQDTELRHLHRAFEMLNPEGKVIVMCEAFQEFLVATWLKSQLIVDNTKVMILEPPGH
jgi:FkbM family methyltransferase